jgi:hypothetical protein
MVSRDGDLARTSTMACYKTSPTLDMQHALKELFPNYFDDDENR